MAKKKANILEQHIDKLVLGLVGIIGLLLLWFFVLRGPYSVEFAGRKFGPGQIDEYILEREVAELREKLNSTPEPRSYDKNYISMFEGIVTDAFAAVDTDVSWPLPGKRGSVLEADRVYAMPDIPELSEPKAAWIRSVAYAPAEPVDMDHPYEEVRTELKDIDFVTVQATLDMPELLLNFEQSFSGRRVKKEWQDRNLAEPVFAEVQLQRREVYDDGSVSQWQEVGRTRIDKYRDMFDIPEKVDELQFGVNILMVEYREPDVLLNILQPAAYDFAVSDFAWLPPSYYEDYEKAMQRVQEEQERELRESRRSMRDERRRPERGGRDGGGMMGMDAPGGGMMDMPGAGQRERDPRDSRRRTARRPEEQELSPQQILAEANRVYIDQRRLQQMGVKEEIVMWSHDDSIVPGKTYEYRMRVGVFNPIAGKDWFREDEKEFKNQVILWSDFTDVTESIAIPKMQEFFPMEVASDGKSANIQVSKFYMGKWRSNDFEVGLGDIIGDVVTLELDEEERRAGGEMLGFARRSEDEAEEQGLEIDFTTDYVLLDITEISDWVGNNVLRSRDYFEVVYSSDEDNIQTRPVKNRNWPDELYAEYTRIRELEKQRVMLGGSRGKGSMGGMDMPGGGMDMPGGGMMMPGGMNY